MSVSVPSSPRSPWTTLTLFVGLLMFSATLFILGVQAGRWTAPRAEDGEPRLALGESWSQHLASIINTSERVRGQEHQEAVETLQHYKEKHPQLAYMVDDLLRVLQEDYEARNEDFLAQLPPDMKTD